MSSDLQRQFDELEGPFLGLYRQGRYADALPLAEAACELARGYYGQNHPEYAHRLNNLAAVHRGQGNFAAAEPLLREAARIERLTYGEDDPTYLISLNNLGALYHQLGDVASAERCLRQAVNSLRASGDEAGSVLPASLGNLAALYASVGNLPEAVALYREAEEVLRRTVGEEHPDYARTLGNLAAALSGAGQTERARQLFLRTAEVYRGSLGEDHPSYALTLNNLGELCRSDGDYDEADRFLGEALAIQGRILGEDHPDYARTLNNLAMVKKARGDWAGAQRLYREVLAVDGRFLGERHPDYAADLKNLSAVCAALGQDAEAFGYMQQADLVDDALIRQVVGMSSEQQRLRFLLTAQGSFEAALSFLLWQGPPAADLARWGLDLVLRRKGIVADTLAAQREEVLRGRYPSLAGQLKELSELRQQIAGRTLAGPGPDGPAAYRELLASLTVRRERLEADLARQVPELASQPPARRAVALALPAGAVLLEFVRFNAFQFRAIPARGESEWGPARYAAFVLPADEPDGVRLIDLGEAGPIDRLIAEFRAVITESGERPSGRDMIKRGRRVGAAEPDQPGPALRRLVFDPLVPALAGRGQLLICPDGDLAYLPFEVLPGDDGRPLIDEYRISYLVCGRDVLRFQARPPGGHAEALVAADPDFDLCGEGTGTSAGAGGTQGRRSRDFGESDLSFDRLPGTRAEGERIAGLLDVRPWLQAEVLETRLKQVRSPWVLHLATHGFFLADQHRDPAQSAWTASVDGGRFSGLRLENPLLRSGLALAGGNTWLKKGQLPPEAEDGLLTAEDVTGMDLLDTELVVLSACNTGLGEIRTGEGVFGLRRAFVLAGARTLVMSLWKVPDEATRELMEDFYHRILAGEGRAEALRNAQRTMKAKYPHPFFWGAFICQGNPGPLPPRRRWYYSLDGKKGHGPVTDVELKDLIRAGQLTRGGKVSLDGKNWHEASRVKGIRWPAAQEGGG